MRAPALELWRCLHLAMLLQSRANEWHDRASSGLALGSLFISRTYANAPVPRNPNLSMATNGNRTSPKMQAKESRIEFRWREDARSTNAIEQGDGCLEISNKQ